MRLAFAIFIPVLGLSAQPFPDAATLLQQRVTALKNCYSYRGGEGGQIRTVDRPRLTRRLGRLTGAQSKGVLAVLQEMFAE